MRQLRNLATLALMCSFIVLSTALLHAFPLNGDLERNYRGTPFGWEKTGAWAYVPLGSYEGSGHYVLKERFAKPGCELVSGSFLLASRDDTILTRLAYRASGEGMSLALVFCDALGRPLGEGWEEPLPPTDDWRLHDARYVMGSTPEPAGTASVRAAVRVEAEGIEVSVDAVSMRKLAAPEPEPGTALTFDPWSGRSIVGPLSAQIAYDCPAEEAPTEDGAEAAAEVGEAEPASTLWLSEPSHVAGTYPYVADAQVTVAGDPAAEALLLLRALGAGPDEVLWQEWQPVACGAAVVPTTVHLPAPFIQPQTMGLQAGFAVQATLPVAAEVADLHLRPVALEVALNGILRKTRFDAPEQVQVFISAVNNTEAELATDVQIAVTNEAGEIVHREQRPIRIRERSAASFPVKPALPGDGSYLFRVSFLRGGKAVGTGEFAFSVGAE